jgi:filamentous hemagglutinin family protein
MSRRPRHPDAHAHGPAARTLAAWLLASLVAAPPYFPALAAPEGEQVVSGEASFARDGDLTVIRPSDGAIIEYSGFDILKHETVRFEQPSESARVLNRISGDPTKIDGALLANGIVYLVNPAGVFFGGEAVVRVSRLVAAAGDISNHDFARGVDRFDLKGPLENRGAIEARAVSLLGRSVANHGSIVAPDGVIALVAGERVVLTQLEGGIDVEVDAAAPGAAGVAGVAQTGTVDAGAGQALFAVGDHYSLAINHEGVTRARAIELVGGDGGLVRVAGLLDASAREPGATGGSVRASGDKLLLEGAVLDASGAAGGGLLRIGGDLRGEGPLQNADRVYVDAQSRLSADALESGDGGSIVLFSEEATGFFGELSARGGAQGGDGGFAELSSNGRLVDEGEKDLRAPAGGAGTLLYDPQDIVIVGGTGDLDDFPNGSGDEIAGDAPGNTLGTILFGDVGNGETPFEVRESELEETDAHIVLEARNSITASGSFDHIGNGEAVGVLALENDRSLTLRTRNLVGDETGATAAPGIDLTGSDHGDALEVRVSGTGNISLETRGEADENGVIITPEAAIRVGALSTSGGRIDLRVAKGDISTQALRTAGADVPAGGNGGNAGNVEVRTGNGGGDIEIASIAAQGGDALDPDAASIGGRGGSVGIRTQRIGDITVGSIDTSGGDSDGAQTGDRGGAAGAVTLIAATAGNLSDILLEGNTAALGGSGGASGTAGGGGSVLFQATGDIEHAGQAGPHVATQGSAFSGIVFDGRNVGSLAPFVVDGGGTDAGRLQLLASGTGRVDAPVKGFNDLLVTANGATADVRITQETDVVHIANSAVVEIDSTATHSEVTAALADELTGDDDVNLQLLVPTGSVRAGHALSLVSEDDIVIGDSDGVAIEMNAIPVPPDLPPDTETISGVLRLLAGSESLQDENGDPIPDATGSVIDGVAGAGAGRIDLKGDAEIASGLLGTSTTGFGAADDPIVLLGGPVAIQNVLSGAVSLRGEGDADLVVGSVPDPITNNTLAGVSALNGSDLLIEMGGDGDLVIESFLFTTPDDMDASGEMLARAGTGRIVLDSVAGFEVLDASGDVTLDGPVALRVDSLIQAGGDVDFLGSVDTDGELTALGSVRSLDVQAAGLTRLAGDVGVAGNLRDVTFAGDVQVEGARSLHATNQLRFLGDVYAESDGAGSLDILAGPLVEFGGHIGEDDAGMGARLGGFSVARNSAPPFTQSLPDPLVLFTDTEPQRVRTGAGGIAFSPAGRLRIPAVATVGKSSGDLLLESVGGSVNLGPSEKLTVGGRVDLVGDAVTFGDVSALELHLSSAAASVRARAPGPVRLKNGGTLRDFGTDLVANVVAFSSDPTVVGAGPAPRVAAESSSNTGSLEVRGLAGAFGADLLRDGDVLLDLVILPLDPGNETPQQPPAQLGLVDPRTGRDTAAGSSLAPGAEETLAFLRCAAEERDDCAAVPASPLDSPRGAELAQRAGLLLGDSAEARDLRARLAQQDPRALRELAIFMTELRLLGLAETEYAAARDALYRQILAGAQPGAPDPGALAAAVRREGRGVPL